MSGKIEQNQQVLGTSNALQANNIGQTAIGSAPTASETNTSMPTNPTSFIAGQKSSSAKSKRKTPVMIGGLSKQISGIAANTTNSKQRQMTLKDMVF